MRQKKQNREVIIIGQHCFNSLGQIRSLGRIGIRPIVIWIDHLAQTPKGSKYIKEFHLFKSFQEGLDYVIKTYSNKGKKYFLTTDSDGIVSLLDNNYDVLKDSFYFFNAGSRGALTRYMPKLEQCKLVERYGLNVPKTELVQVGSVPKTISYPIFTKATDCFGVTWKESAIICRNEEELKEAYKRIPAREILLQEYIEKDNEIALEGISSYSGDVVFLPIQGEYVRLPDGKYGTYKKNESYKLGQELLCKIQAVIKEIHYSGVFEVEFLRDKKGRLFFLEINFRHTQYNHAFTCMGMNFSEIWMELCEGNNRILENVSLSKDPSYVMNEFRDIREFLMTKKISVRQWLKDFKKADCYYFYDRKDLRFVYFYFLRVVKNRVKNSFAHLSCQKKTL